MLPFMKAKKISSSIMARTKAKGGIEDERMEDEEDPALMSAAQDLISAIGAKDAEGVCEALEAAFQILDSQPEDEEME